MNRLNLLVITLFWQVNLCAELAIPIQPLPTPAIPAPTPLLTVNPNVFLPQSRPPMLPPSILNQIFSNEVQIQAKLEWKRDGSCKDIQVSTKSGIPMYYLLKCIEENKAKIKSTSWEDFFFCAVPGAELKWAKKSSTSTQKQNRLIFSLLPDGISQLRIGIEAGKPERPLEILGQDSESSEVDGKQIPPKWKGYETGLQVPDTGTNLRDVEKTVIATDNQKTGIDNNNKCLKCHDAFADQPDWTFETPFRRSDDKQEVLERKTYNFVPLKIPNYENNEVIYFNEVLDNLKKNCPKPL